ncbi:NAD(P)H-binding protein [Streptomyces sp. NPDC058542]|uniref:NAD(P)H-binding protein n=1 Tax=Streptomyces sp. NPDC058542 TaxID=3346543 RepID=UPI0036541757
MHIVIAGGHGRVALKLTRLLAARGHRISGIIRRSGQSGALRAAGSQPLLLDLTTATPGQLATALTGADAVVFAAGIGRGGSTRAHPVDRDAPLTVADAAELAGVRRYLMLSALGADPAMKYPADPEIQAFMRGKGEVDKDLASRSALDCTILRPSYFRDGPGTGLIRLAERTGPGQVDRADVAAVLAALVVATATAGRTLELISGTTPIDEAVAAACRYSPAHLPTPRREQSRHVDGPEAGGRSSDFAGGCHGPCPPA